MIGFRHIVVLAAILLQPLTESGQIAVDPTQSAVQNHPLLLADTVGYRIQNLARWAEVVEETLDEFY